MNAGPVARAQRIGLGVVLLLGGLDAWRYLNYQVNPDGVSYIDLAIAFARDGPGALVNGYWSPLLPGLIGLAFRAFPPTLDTLYQIAHLVAFAVFVVTTLAFNQLLTAMRHHLRGATEVATGALVTIVALGWTVYALYILKGVGVQLITPDMGVSALAFWLATATLSLGAEPWPTRRWVMTGAVLALGYWWKAILLPVGAVWFLAAAALALRRRDSARGPALAALTYAALALVVIVPVSRQTGRVTFGETGRLNYLWYVNGAPYVWERCRTPGTSDARAEPFGRIAHDSVIATAPLTCLLSSPAPGATMPLWDDPSRYYRDTHMRADLRRQRGAIRTNVRYLLDGIADFGPVTFATFALVGIAAAAIAVRSRRGRRIDPPASALPLTLLVGAPVAFYLMVYVEFRHLAPFFVIVGAIIPWIAVVTWRERSRVLLAAFAVAAFADVVTRLSDQTLIGLALARATVAGRAPERIPVTHVVARALRSSGLQPDTRVASLYDAWNAEWAQLAGLKIRAHVPDVTTPLPGVLTMLRDPCTRAAWDGALRDHRIEAVVARIPVGLAAPPDFTRIADTEFHLHRVPRSADPASGCNAARAPRAATRSSSGTAAR